MRYFDIDDLLKNEQKLKVKFNCDLTFPKNIRFRKKERIELPLFLADIFLQNDHCVLAGDLLTNEEKDELIALSPNFPISQKCRVFYDFASYVYSYQDNFLQEIFLERMQSYFKLIHKENLEIEDVVKLDEKETKIILKARESFFKFNK